MSACSVLQAIQNLAQIVDDFLSSPSSLTTSAINNLVLQIELIKGSVQELPINSKRKGDIISRLNQAESILQSTTSSLRNIERILAVSQILQTVVLKIQNLRLPCPQGKTTVVSSNTFSTICNFCR